MDEKVLLILVDGMRPDGMHACGDHWLEEYYKKGTYCLNAKTVYPSVTLPCHISLFHSISPERHGTLDNDFKKMDQPVAGLFEKLTQSGRKTAMFYIWEQLRDVYPPGFISYSWFMAWEHYTWMNLDERATDACIQHISEFAPDFVFLYLGETDEYGHQYGWMSEEYLDCIRRASGCIRKITEMLPEQYSVIVTADHGGHDYEHGSLLPEDMTIPVTFHGRRFQKETEITDLSILDITPTIADVIGIEPEQEWEGRSVCI